MADRQRAVVVGEGLIRREGFVGWDVMDEPLRSLGAAERAVVYPVFKARRLP